MTKKPSNPNVSDSIDQNLRRVYQRVIEEDVPDRFKDLLSQLKAKDGKGEQEGSGS